MRSSKSREIIGLMFSVITAICASSASAQSCLDAPQMLDYSLEELKQKKPCDSLGRYFLAYNGISTSLARGYYDAEGLYYVTYRQPHLSDDQDSFDDSTVARLMSSLAMVSSLEAVKRESYKFLILREYAMRFGEKLEEIEKTAVAAAIIDATTRSGFRTVEELNCFVASDVPGVSVAEILASKFYENCIFLNGE